MCQFWGGFEYDENPMFIYQYSDLVGYSDIFLTGAAVLFSPVPTQEFILNVTDSYSGKFVDEYGAGAKTYDGQELEGSRHPLCYIFNWNASYLDGIFKTRWAVGSYTQARIVDSSEGDLHNRLVYLGQSLNFPRFQIYFDIIKSWEDIDRLRIASPLLCRDGVYLTDVRYDAMLTKANWQFADKFNLMGKLMYDTSSTPFMPTFRKSLGYIASLEYYPMKDQDLRFFTAFIGKNLRYSPESGLQKLDGFTGRIELGFMYRIKAY